MPHVVLVDSLNINIGFEPVPGVMACKLAELHSPVVLIQEGTSDDTIGGHTLYFSA